MKGQACSWRDIRKIKYVMENADKLKGELSALERCTDKSTRSHWRRAIEVMEADVGFVNETKHFQPTHAAEIARAFPKQPPKWAKWVKDCEARKWTVSELRRQLRAAKRGGDGTIAIPTDVAKAIQHASLEEFLPTISDVDAIITDPPYGAEFLPLYGELARLAVDALAPHGILAVMTGQSYLPEVLTAMTAHIPYRWTMAYLTPGGQAVQLWDRKVNTFWKPVLLFGGTPEWIGDVVHSDVNANEKKFHDWGQSESGMARLVERLTTPGQLVCDPFLGGGTTAVVCTKLGRRFTGCDKDLESVATSRQRVTRAAKEHHAPHD